MLNRTDRNTRMQVNKSHNWIGETKQIELIIIYHALAARMDVTGGSQGYPYSLHGCPTKLPLHETTGVPQLKLPIHITAGVPQSY